MEVSAKSSTKIDNFSNFSQKKLCNLEICTFVLLLVDHWLKCELIWLLMIVVQPQLGFVMNAPKHLELNDPWESIPCKFTRLNWFVTNVPRILELITRNFSGICKGPTSLKRKRKTACTSVGNVPDHLIMRKIWSAIWPNIKYVHFDFTNFCLNFWSMCILISWFLKKNLKEGTLKPGDTEQQKEFVCDQCGKVYGNYKSWFYHVKSHSVIYQCQTVSLFL